MKNAAKTNNYFLNFLNDTVSSYRDLGDSFGQTLYKSVAYIDF